MGTAGTLIVDIRLAGQLDDHWAAVLGDLVLIRLDDGTTRLTGPVVDQAQLHGILARIRDLGVPLLSLHTIDDDDASGDTASQNPTETPPRSSAGGRVPHAPGATEDRAPAASTSRR